MPKEEKFNIKIIANAKDYELCIVYYAKWLFLLVQQKHYPNFVSFYWVVFT